MEMTDKQHWFQRALMKWFAYNESKTSTYVLYINNWKDIPQSKSIKKLCIENHYLPVETDEKIRIEFEELAPDLIRNMDQVRSHNRISLRSAILVALVLKINLVM